VWFIASQSTYSCGFRTHDWRRDLVFSIVTWTYIWYQSGGGFLLPMRDLIMWILKVFFKQIRFTLSHAFACDNENINLLYSHVEADPDSLLIRLRTILGFLFLEEAAVRRRWCSESDLRAHNYDLVNKTSQLRPHNFVYFTNSHLSLELRPRN